MKVLALPRYTALGASSRQRFYLYQETLAATGIFVQYAPFFSDRYILNLQQGKKSFLDIAWAYLRRLWYVFKIGSFDVLWVEKETFPYLPFCVESLILKGHKNVIMDYDDAVFHTYDLHRVALVRSILGGKIASLMSLATTVVVGNAYLKSYATIAKAKHIEEIPTVIDLDFYRQETKLLNSSGTGKVTRKFVFKNDRLLVGWIGQRSTAYALVKLLPLFLRLKAEGVADFVAVGVSEEVVDYSIHVVPWDRTNEVYLLKSFDVGIMPLGDTPFERGKCGYKLVQYMACGLPVIASPVGVNVNLVHHGVNGFLCNSNEEWETAIRTLASDPSLRLLFGQSGQTLVEESYSLHVSSPKLTKLFNRIR